VCPTPKAKRHAASGAQGELPYTGLSVRTWFLIGAGLLLVALVVIFVAGLCRAAAMEELAPYPKDGES
jgi:hypothetical protein